MKVEAGQAGRPAPQVRLVWVAAIVALPALTLAGISSFWIAPCAALLGISAAVAIVDLVRGQRRIEDISISLPENLRLTKNIAADSAGHYS